MRTPSDGQLPDREVLYEQVWTKPISHLALEYAVKYWDVQTWCKQLNVPLPDRGYWTRARHGHTQKRPPLPAGPNSARDAEAISFPKESELSFLVPDRLKDPDPITLAAKAGLEIARQDKHFVYTEDGQFPIRVAKANVGRALRILDTLVKCWLRRGYRIELHDRQAFIWIREIRQRVSLWEKTKEDPKHKAGERKKMLPTGKLAIKMDWWGGRDWRDGAVPLEGQIRNIVDHMERSARQLEREKEVPQGKTVVNVVAETASTIEVVEEKEAVVETDAPIDHLIAESRRWKELKVVDEYLMALELTVPHTPEFLKWLESARALRKADDPLIRQLS